MITKQKIIHNGIIYAAGEKIDIKDGEKLKAMLDSGSVGSIEKPEKEEKKKEAPKKKVKKDEAVNDNV